VGHGIAGWQPGQRVGVGWNGGYCGHCDHCRRGEFFACVDGQVTGITYDGGYAEYMIAPASAVALMPAELPPVDAAPLMCAGLTTFNALRNSGARPGDVVAVLGLGGLGHLAVQYAAKMGFHTVGIARGTCRSGRHGPSRSAKYGHGARGGGSARERRTVHVSREIEAMYKANGRRVRDANLRRFLKSGVSGHKGAEHLKAVGSTV
jgi:Zn-dependent alcohol dehydrogenase